MGKRAGRGVTEPPTSAPPAAPAARERLLATTPGFVGRDRELAALREALADPPTVVLIEGEAGIGKTRLVRELIDGDGARVLVAGCPPLRQPQTLAPLVDALRRRVDPAGGLGLSALGGALRSLLPEWSDALPPALGPPEDATAARHRLFRALAELLERVKIGVLVVEDAHWADEATLEFLLFLRADQDAGISLVLTSRPDEIQGGSLLRRLTAHRPVTRIGLEPLGLGETAQVVSSMLAGHPVSGEFARFLYQRTEGVPLAIEESVRLLANRADVVRRDGELVRRNLSRISVPATIRDAVLERAGRLSAHAQAMLAAAAVLGEPAAEAVVCLVSGIPNAPAQSGLAEAVASGLADEDRQGLVSFRHVLTSQAVYEAVPASVRRAMHLRAAEALAERSPATPAQLARHFREAGDTARWARHAEQAADLAAAAGDESTSDRVLQELIVHGGLAADGLARLAAKVCYVVYAPQEYGDLTDALRAPLADQGLSRQTRAALRLQLARVLTAADENDAARAELERAAPDLPAGSMEAARAMHKLAWPRGTSSPAAEHLSWLRRAEKVAPVDGTPADRLWLRVDRVTSLLALGEESGWAEAARLPDSSAWGGYMNLVGAMNIADEAVRWGRFEEATWRLDAALLFASDHGYDRIRDIALVTLAHLAWHTGDWEGLAGRTAQLATDSDVQAGARAEAAVISGLLHSAAGERALAREDLSKSLEQMRQHGTAQYVMEPAAALARLSMAEGDVAGALAVTDEPVAVVLAKGIWTWAAEPVPVRVDALAAAGRIAEAASLTTRMAAGLRGKNAPAAQAALALCRAILAQARAASAHEASARGASAHGGSAHGGSARAAAAFGRAADAWQTVPRPYDALLARERSGRCLLAAGQRDKALALLTDVARDLAKLGASGDADRVLRTLRASGVIARRPVSGRPSYGGELSPRELQVVALLTSGRTDKEIAEGLFLSPKTVAAHLDSARRKLGVPSRTALAVAALDAGLVDAGVTPAARRAR